MNKTKVLVTAVLSISLVVGIAAPALAAKAEAKPEALRAIVTSAAKAEAKPEAFKASAAKAEAKPEAFKASAAKAEAKPEAF
ncbi:hypothetical protein [Paenibacillus sp. PL2-23]|uniref:hypothetical protein n=1 Tax=Paenibacillus sp. PL2-23 TaxID=2100729 RepID=UPI0030FB57E6